MLKPHIRKARGNIDGRWIVTFAGRMWWANTLGEARELALAINPKR